MNYEQYPPNVSAAERRAYLRRELKEYLSTRKVTPEELLNLKEWVRNGYSVFDNAWGASDENGWTLDYLAAEELLKEFCEQAVADRLLDIPL